jgi:hypothetical protein
VAHPVLGEGGRIAGIRVIKPADNAAYFVPVGYDWDRKE